MENDKSIYIEDIELCNNNPRWFNLQEEYLDNQEKELFIKKIIEGNKNESEEYAFNKLLSNEGDLNRLFSLMRSIEKFGYDGKDNKIYLLKKPNEEKKYIVVEGNRRILSLKFFLRIKKFPNLDFFINNEPIFLTLGSQDFENYEENLDNKNSILKYHRKIKNILQKKNSIEQKIKSSDYEIINNDNRLLDIVWLKHIAGELPGMKKWNRGKYFVDILNILKNYNSGDREYFEDIIQKKLKRDFNKCLTDYKHAQFVKDIVLSFFDENSYNKENTLYRCKKIMSSEINVTPWQQNFSLKVLKQNLDKIFGVKKEEFEKNYFKVNYDENNKIYYTGNEKIRIKILKLLYKWCWKQWITTRGIKEGYEDKFKNELKEILIYKPIKIESILFETPFNKSPEFIKKEIEFLNMFESKSYFKKILLLEKTIKSINLIDSFNIDSDPKKNKTFFPKIFSNLYEQINILIKGHNGKDKEDIINGITTSIRCIIDLFLIIGYYHVLESGKQQYKFDKEKYNEDIPKKLKDVISLGISKSAPRDFRNISTISSKIREQINQKKWQNFINDLFSNLKIKSNIEKKKENILFLIKDETYKFLNSGIHSPHLFLNNKFYETNINILNKSMEFIIIFQEDLLKNEKVFSDLNHIIKQNIELTYQDNNQII